jgi:hypothetical protein
MKTLISVLAALLATACAPMTTADRDAREYRRTDFRQQFVEDRERCHALGGRIYILAHGGQLDRSGIPVSRAYYKCT